MDETERIVAKGKENDFGHGVYLNVVMATWWNAGSGAAGRYGQLLGAVVQGVDGALGVVKATSLRCNNPPARTSRTGGQVNQASSN